MGRQVDGLINQVAGSYVIGNGAPGAAAGPTGGAVGWLLGDGGLGWTSTEAGVAGGDGGAGTFTDTGQLGHGRGSDAPTGASGYSGTSGSVGPSQPGG